MNDIFSSLRDLGFSQIESKVYIVALKSGTTTAQQIAKRAGIPRSTTYQALDSLQQRGLVSQFRQKGIKHYSVLDPRDIEKEVANKLAIAQQIVPLLQDEMEFKPNTMDFEYYEGERNVKKIFRDAIDRAGDMIYAFFSFEEESKALNNYTLRYFMPQRLKKKIYVKSIVPNSERGIWLKDHDSEQLRTTKLAAKEVYSMKNTVMIYADTYTIINYHPEIVGYKIRNSEVAKAQKEIFELLWQSLG